jgi:hypothetical protein
MSKNRASDGRLWLDRRTLLVLGAGAGAMAVASLPPLAAKARATTPRYVVTDRRHADSLAYGVPLVAQGSTPLDVADGLTALWRDALLPLWQSSPDRGPGHPSVAGLTSHEVWTCLREQARSHGRHAWLVDGPLAPSPIPASAALVAWVIA